jgi:kynurenine formamidase
LDDLQHGVHHWARKGIVGRGVLADVDRWRQQQGRPLRANHPDPITAEDVLGTLAAQGSIVEPGDILLVRTGWVSWYRTLDTDERAQLASTTISPSVGLQPGEAVASMLWDLHVAAVAADNPALELMPFGGLTDPAEMTAAFGDPERAEDTFVHFRILALLGIPIGEFWDLDALASDCQDDGVYHFLLTATPLNLHGGVGSPANAVAVK